MSEAEREAEEAFAAGDFARAQLLANALVNDPERRPRVKARGLALRAMGFCVHNPDEDRARAAVRQLGPRHPLRGRVLAFCRARGFLGTVD